MEVAKVTVSGVRADVKDLKPITSGMVGATVSFTFEDPLWNELTKTVVYKTRHGVRDDLEIGEDGVSKIPPELLICYGLELKVGVYGINDDGDLVIPTVWASLDFIKAGADPSGDPGTNPALPPWHRLRQDVDELDERVQALAEADKQLGIQIAGLGEAGLQLQERVQTLEERPAVASWNDLTDKPFYEETGIWDGDMTGHEVLQIETGFWLVKISDYVPTEAECIGAELTLSTPEGENNTLVVTAEMVADIAEAFGISCFMVGPDVPFVGVVRESGTVQGTEVSAGTYYAYIVENGEPFYTSFFSTLKVVRKLDSKYIDAEWMATRKIGKGTAVLEAAEYTTNINIGNAEMGKADAISKVALEGGKIYIVEFDGVTFVRNCVEIDDGELKCWYIGNFAFGDRENSNTGEPFCIYVTDFLTEDTLFAAEGNHTMALYEAAEIVEKLPEEFLPDSVVLNHDTVQIEALIEADMLPAVYDASGAILTDENGNIILRY